MKRAVCDACEVVHSESDENHVRAEGFQREYKKKDLFASNIYV